MKSIILGVGIDDVTQKQALERVIEFLSGSKYGNLVITPNPEGIILTKKDPEFKEILETSELVVADGTGVFLASKLNKVKLKERVPGCDLLLSALDYIKDKEYTAYFLGAGKGVAEEAKRKMELAYPGVKIVGVHDGYFDAEEELKILNEIKELKPDILAVGLGMGRQEKWMYKYKNELPVKVSFGIGGSIDIMAGTVKRAPKIFRKLGLEWFYRLISQPSRFFRMLNLPKFVILVLLEKAGIKK